MSHCENQPSATTGPGHTQFGRALFELNIDGILRKHGLSKRARGTGAFDHAGPIGQKELRLEGISTLDAANAFMPAYSLDSQSIPMDLRQTAP